MNRVLTIIIGLLMSVSSKAMFYHTINYDPATSAALLLGYKLQDNTEKQIAESAMKILDHYTSAEVASAGIFASKWLDRQAYKDVGIFGNSEENYYYKRIYMMVSTKIMPKILDVSYLLIKHPDKAIYWGPYLYKICEQTRQLCMIFETVVTNGKLSFRDLVFLTISDALRPIFDLAKLGNVDWGQMWEDFVDFGTGITKEDLLEDLSDILSAGTSIASAGGAILDSVWTNRSKVGQIFHSKPREIKKMYDNFKDMFETFSDPGNIKDLVMEQIGSTDSTGVVNLFKIDNYNITSYISDYVHEITGQYYTQRWYIYQQDNGSQQVCSYAPPMGSYDKSNGPEWYRVNTRDQNYTYNSNDYENSLRNSEGYAGWSRSQCQSLNNQDKNIKYTFSNNITWSRILDTSGNVRSYAYAHYIDVTKSWGIYEEVYEELFDSQYDAVEAIQARFNAKLQELNCNEEGKHYYLGLGSKHYYSAADEAKLKGCAVVSFQMQCDEKTDMGEGSFSWKENASHNHGINEESHLLAMKSTLGDGPDYSEVDSQLETWGDQVSSLQSQIDYLEQQNYYLLEEISTSSVEDAVNLRAQYNDNKRQISVLTPQLEEAESNLKTYQNIKQEMVDDFANELDGTYRIPAVMHELESGFNITWTDEGSWQGNSFIRHGKMPNIDGFLTFRADLTLERPEKHHWLIGRYHRAILAVHWTLTSEYGSSSIVDTMELDNSLSEEDKAAKVNERLRQLMAENPGCSIEANYAYSNPETVAEDPDAIHLLWVSDRLAIARDVDYRISKIYAQLILIEKFLRTRETLLDYVKASLGFNFIDGPARTSIGNKSFRRWRRSAAAVTTGQKLSDIISGDEE